MKLVAIGARIRALRLKRKLTLEALGRVAGVSYQYLSGIENGKVNFSFAVLDRIADALETRIDVLLADPPRARA